MEENARILVQPIVDGAGLPRKVTKNLARPFRRLAKKLAKPLQNLRAVKIFEAYDASLQELATAPPSSPSSAVSLHRPIHAVYSVPPRLAMLRMSLVSCSPMAVRTYRASTSMKTNPTR